ncbi:MAG: ABC transporter permease [Blastocatellia bacterium]|jgi:putative ABC transport system permease protein|nr:ABC transporter permease [Blastocatellia bacterium]
MKKQILRDIALTVFDSLRAHKLRSALTLIGVIIGTAVVVMVGAVLTGLSARVAQVTERSAPNTIYFTKSEKIGPSFRRQSAEERQRKELTYEDALAVAALDKPLAVSPQKIRGSYGPTANKPTMTARGREAINPLVLGVWENFPEIVSVNVDRGRFFTLAERESRANVCVIGAGIAQQLFEEIDPIDQDVRIDGRVFRIVGLLEKASGQGVIGSDDLDERIVYAPFETMAKFYPEIEEVAIVVRAPAGKVDEVIDQATYTLRVRRNVPADAPNNFGVNRAEQVFEAVQQILVGLAAIVVPIALAGLLVGGVGVMNIMLVSVTERAPEIGIRRAIGARRRDVLAQFLMEAVTLTGAGGILGILVGFSFAFLLNFVVDFPAAVPLWAVVVGFFASASVGLIAGMWPALRAARLDPVVAIRGD